MAEHKRGRQSFVLSEPPVITTWASVAGKRESEGPLAYTFDIKCRDTYFGQKTWEQAEKYMQQQVLRKLADKAGMVVGEFDLVFSGDLLNQCIGSLWVMAASEPQPLNGQSPEPVRHWCAAGAKVPVLPPAPSAP